MKQTLDMQTVSKVTGCSLDADHNDVKRIGDNIDKDRTKNNLVYTYQTKKYEHLPSIKSARKSFKATESEFYIENFGDWLNACNDKKMAQHHLDQVRDMEDIQQSKMTCPTSIVWEIGNMEEHPSPQEVFECHREWLNWMHKTYPTVVCVDSAMHLDEATPHFHDRFVFVATDPKTGFKMPNKNKCLEQLGVAVKDSSNAKAATRLATFTEDIRDKAIEIARSHGIDMDDAPKVGSKISLSDREYKRKKAHDTNLEIKDLYSDIKRLKGKISDLNDELLELAVQRDKQRLEMAEEADRQVPYEWAINQLIDMGAITKSQANSAIESAKQRQASVKRIQAEEAFAKQQMQPQIVNPEL